MKKALFIASAALLASACASTQTAMKPTPIPSFDTSAEAIAAAETATKEAASLGYEWRDTGKIIAAAKKAESAKESEKAMQLAVQALRQSTNAKIQYAMHKDDASRF